jgi:hypothetical protein
MLRVVLGIFELQEFSEDFVVDFPATGFVLGAGLSAHEKRGDVGQGSGATLRDAVGGDRFKELAEDMVDVDVGDVIAGETGEFGGEVGLCGWLGSAMAVAKMGEAKTVAIRIGGKGTVAAISKLELTQGGGGGSFVGHDGESVAK